MTIAIKQTINVSTQGLTFDLQANNDFTVIERGKMDEAQFFQLLETINNLAFDESLDTENDCLPYIMVQGKNGHISLSKEKNQQFYCAEIDDNLDLTEAFDIAIGNIPLEENTPKKSWTHKLLTLFKKMLVLIAMLIVLVLVHEWSGV